MMDRLGDTNRAQLACECSSCTMSEKVQSNTPRKTAMRHLSGTLVVLRERWFMLVRCQLFRASCAPEGYRDA